MRKRFMLFVEESWLLLFSTVVCGVALASLDAWWGPKIAEQQRLKFDSLARSILPKAERFEEALAADQTLVKVGGKQVPTAIMKAVGPDGGELGWVFQAEGAGFADKIRLVVGVDPQFDKVAGFGVLFSNETPGFGDRIKGPEFRDQFAGAPAGGLLVTKTGDRGKIDADIVAMTGATVTSDAVVKIVNDFIAQIRPQMKAKGLM